MAANRFYIDTCHPDTVEALLLSEELIEKETVEHPGNVDLQIAYADDSLSQALTYWLAMAQGCKLINSYEFEWRGYT